ncbi:hypothetical protein M1N07_03405 [Thermodesulfovibrionales bacterium]|nr:hypothetical protein [Thermodesulfovibrionales bacterium]
MKVSGKAKVSVCTILIIAAFLLTGCGNALEWAADDDSREARLETARMALDDRNYAEALRVLGELDERYPNDPEVSELLSNAHAGKAGLDTFALLETIDALGDKGQAGNIDMVGLVLGDEKGTLTKVEIGNKIGNLTSAIKALSDLEDAGLTLTYDQRIQRGLLSVNRAALTIAEIIMADIRDARNIEIEHIKLTEEGIRHLYSDIYTIDFRDIEEAITERLATLSADIKNVADSVEAITKVIGIGNELAENFEKFKNAVDTDKIKGISIEDLESYIANLLGGVT